MDQLSTVPWVERRVCRLPSLCQRDSGVRDTAGSFKREAWLQHGWPSSWVALAGAWQEALVRVNLL